MEYQLPATNNLNEKIASQLNELHQELTAAQHELKNLSDKLALLSSQITTIQENDFPVQLPDLL